MAFDIKIDDVDFQEKLKKLSEFPKEVPRAARAATKRTVSTVKKTMSKEVSSKYKIRSGEVKETITTQKPTSKDLIFYIHSRGTRYTLSHFEKNLKKVVTEKESDIRVEVKKGSPKIIRTSPKAFIAPIKGNFLIAKRKGVARKPIVTLKTLSIPQMIKNENISKQIETVANDTLQKRLEHEVEYRLQKYTK